MKFAFRAKNLGPLRNVDWRISQGVSVVVGPNGVGKSTLLRLPEFGRIALKEDLNAATAAVFEGVSYLQFHGAPPSDEIRFGASVQDADWDVSLAIAGGAIAQFSAESVRVKTKAVFQRKRGDAEIEGSDGARIIWGDRLIPCGFQDRMWAIDKKLGSPIMERVSPNHEMLVQFANELDLPGLRPEQILALAGLASSLRLNRYNYRTYHYHITHTAKYGSQNSSDLSLLETGENVFPLLRNWRDRSEHEHRFDFVLATLREAFPHVKKLDFEQAGQTVTVAVVDNRYSGKKTPISRESTGFLTALLHLCAIASCDKGGLVTLDELETSLHPRAIKVLISAFRSWAKEHDLSIVLATQSETVLDQFQEEPEKIQVLEPKMSPGPKPLTELYDPEWLKQFSLGDLFGQLEYGSGNTE